MFGHHDSPESDYPHKNDIPLTPNEHQEITRLKQEILADLKKAKATREVLEMILIKSSIYAFARILLLLGGQIGMYFCFASLLISFGYDNKDFFEDNSISLDNSLKVQSMNKLSKLILSLITLGFFAYTTVGDYFGLLNLSQQSYILVEKQLDKFNSPKVEENKDLIAVVVGATVVLVAVSVGSRIHKR